MNIDFSCKSFEKNIFNWLDAHEVFMVEPDEKKQAFYHKKRMYVVNFNRYSS